MKTLLFCVNIFTVFFWTQQKFIFALYHPRFMINEKNINIAMISMRTMLLIAVTEINFLSKTVIVQQLSNNIFCKDPEAKINLSDMNVDKFIFLKWTIFPAIVDFRSSGLKKILQIGFFRIFSFVILDNPLNPKNWQKCSFLSWRRHGNLSESWWSNLSITIFFILGEKS